MALSGIALKRSESRSERLVARRDYEQGLERQKQEIEKVRKDGKYFLRFFKNIQLHLPAAYLDNVDIATQIGCIAG